MYSSDNIKLLHGHIIKEVIIILNIHSVTFSELCYSLVIWFIQMFLHLLILQYLHLPFVYSFTNLSLHPFNI